MAELLLLHTVETLRSLFDRLVEQRAPGLRRQHLVVPGLLELARAAVPAGELRAAVEAELAPWAGPDRVLLCTCSSIGAAAEKAGTALGLPALRVDRPMAEAAVDAGERLLVAATLESTLGPTLALIDEVARLRGRRVRCRTCVCPAAWERMEAGDREGSYRMVAEAIRRELGDAQAVVLAQASMAPVAGLCRDLPVPVLSSPESGVARAVAWCQSAGRSC